MAIQPPPSAPVVPGSTPIPPAKRSGCAGCGMGCLGCIGMLVVVLLLLVGGGWYFFVVQAQAGVPAPAALVVFNAPVDVGKNDSGYRTAVPGEALSAGSSVRTGHAGRAAIQFPDGSFIRMSSDTALTVTSAQLNKDGTLQSAGVAQKIGRTLSNVQHLISGSSFHVGGHSVSAEVRGTQFEVLVRANGTNLIKVFDGTVKVAGSTTLTLAAGQEVDADANGRLSAPRVIQPDAQDPYPLAAQCARTVLSGTTAGTTQTSTGDSISTGQSSEVDYNSPGGLLSVALCYPGSFMTLTIIDPNGTAHSSRQSSRPVQGTINGPPGRYRAIVKAEDVPGGEPFAVSFATNTPCVEGKIDTGGVVRQTVSNKQITDALSQSGATGISLAVQGTSPNSARIYYSSDLNGTPVSWTIDFYAATPNLGVTLTQLTVRGVNITTQVVSRLPQATGQTGVSIDFIVDRVYSCSGLGGLIMVIEGHR
ncbi:MAG: FecR domain-containing protein [Chloroflexi bacterium]|nr:MAG: FecR domain-containing protein [Chloroflexota bacterium]